MIEDPPLLTLRRNFTRPSKEQVAAFKGVQTGHVVDAMNGRGALDGRIKPVSDVQAQFCGVAVTSHSGPADNLAAFASIEISGEGDVIVAAADGFEGTAVAGDLMLAIAKNRGVVAFVTDGYVRDITGIQGVGMPCFSAGVTPNSPARNGPGTVGQAIVLGGVAVNSGDIVVGDVDGVVIVPFDMIDGVIDALKAIRAAEAEMEAKVQGGLTTPSFIQAVFDSGRIEEID